MKRAVWIALICLAFNHAVFADVMQQVQALQTRWAEVNYTLTADKQEAAYEKLIMQADEVVITFPTAAEAYIWRGIIESSFAGAKGGLGALSLAKAAKADFEKALKINEKALQGSAYTSLGTLYFKVPGWPIGFGDDDKAALMLKKALVLNPDGIDSNYFYGEFLADQQQFEAAERFLIKAQQAPARPERPLADKGRQNEIKKALEQVRHQLKN